MEEIVPLVQNFGVPCGICLYVLYEKFAADKRHEKRYNLIIDVINKLEKTVDKLVTIVDERLK